MDFVLEFINPLAVDPIAEIGRIVKHAFVEDTVTNFIVNSHLSR